jgi:hypothetical protein
MQDTLSILVYIYRTHFPNWYTYTGHSSPIELTYTGHMHFPYFYKYNERKKETVYLNIGQTVYPPSHNT